MLLDRTGLQQDLWSREETPPAGTRLLVNWELFVPRLPNDPACESIGIELPNTFDPQVIQPHFSQLGLIAISFPAFSDGRGFTLAKRLRRLGFTGVLRAVGPLIPDQFAYALACGFDEVELPEASAERQSSEQWTAALAARSQTYQQAYAGKETSILAQRRLAREASHA